MPRPRLPLFPRPRPIGTAVDLDRGAQPERTTMSWSRTWLALLVVTAVFLRWSPHYGPGLLVLPVVTTAAALLVALTQRRRARRGVHGIREERLTADPTGPLLLTALTLAVGAAGIGFVIAAP